MGLDLSVHLGIRFVDLDQQIEKATKQSVAEIFLEKEEAYFRQLEKLHLEKVVSELDSFIMATGGGTPAFFTNLQVMKNEGKTIFIDTPIETIAQRLKNDSIRPLMESTTLSELNEKRKGWYNQADYIIREYKELVDLF